MTKRKIIQIINYKGDLKLLKFRLENFENVDLFVLIHNSETTKDVKHEKIIWIHNPDKIGDVSESYFIDTVTNFLEGFCQNFDDIIFICEENEFPDTNEVERINEELKYGPFFIGHTNFWWGRNYISSNIKKGSLVFSYSTIIKDKNPLEQFLKTKMKNSSLMTQPSFFGWTFNKFELPEDSFNIFRENLLPENDFSSKLTTFNLDFLPPNFDSLPVYHPKPKKILITSVKEDFNENYDKMVLIEFDNEGKEFIHTSDLVEYHIKIILPSKVLYGNKNYEDFLEEYKLNEIYKVFEMLKVTEHDSIEIKNPS